MLMYLIYILCATCSLVCPAHILTYENLTLYHVSSMMMIIMMIMMMMLTLRISVVRETKKKQKLSTYSILFLLYVIMF